MSNNTKLATSQSNYHLISSHLIIVFILHYIDIVPNTYIVHSNHQIINRVVVSCAYKHYFNTATIQDHYYNRVDLVLAQDECIHPFRSKMLRHPVDLLLSTVRRMLDWRCTDVQVQA